MSEIEIIFGQISRKNPFFAKNFSRILTIFLFFSWIYGLGVEQNLSVAELIKEFAAVI